MSIEENEKEVKKILGVLSNPAFAIIGYLGVMLILGLLGFLENGPASLGCSIFAIFFAIYYLSYTLRRKLQTEEEKKSEDKYDDWISGQRGP